MRSGWRLILPLGVAGLLVVALGACSRGGDLIVGATTSLQDTGILDEMIRAFQEESGFRVAAVTPIVAGSGQVLELARRGEVDVVITHSPAAEERLIAEGDGIDRRPVMENFFLVVGPGDDPAVVREVPTPAQAFRRIAESGRSFISRGDGSGTHMRELAIWQEAGLDPHGRSWYQESATGQGQNLLIASDRGAYTLVDSATFRVFQERVELVPYVIDEQIRNRYSVTLVNPERHGGVNAEAAKAFADFLTSAQGQRLIEEFGRDQYGESLFLPLGSPRLPPTSPTPSR